MEYYYLDEQNRQQGPVEASEFKTLGLGPDTMMWRNGLTDWVRASELPEYASALATSCVQFGGSSVAESSFEESPMGAEAPKCHLPLSIWALVLGTLSVYGIFIVAPFAILGIVFNVLAYNFWKKGNYAVMERMEKKSGVFARVAFIISLVILALVGTVFMFAILANV